jgi:hypothetical protein
MTDASQFIGGNRNWDRRIPDGFLYPGTMKIRRENDAALPQLPWE